MIILHPHESGIVIRFSVRVSFCQNLFLSLVLFKVFLKIIFNVIQFGFGFFVRFFIV